MTHIINFILYLSDLWKNYWRSVEKALDFIDILDIIPGFVFRFVSWIGHNVREYFVRIAFAILGKQYIPDWAYWNTGDYINDQLMYILPKFLENKHSYPIQYHESEGKEYFKKLNRLYKLLKIQTENEWETGSDYQKIMEKKQKCFSEYQKLFGELVPTLWD